jgi:Na+/H+-dicarboxylate symporter
VRSRQARSSDHHGVCRRGGQAPRAAARRGRRGPGGSPVTPRARRAGVAAGLAGGGALRAAAGGPWTGPAADLLGFPGELMLRLLKMLVLPLVAGSMVAGVCALRGAAGAGVGRVARATLAYYAATTAAAVGLGVALVELVQPGAPLP